MPAEMVSVAPILYYYRGLSLTKEKLLSLLTAETPEDMKSALKGTWLEGLPLESMAPEEVEKEAFRTYLKALNSLRNHVASRNLKEVIEVMKDAVRARDVLTLLRSSIMGKNLDEVKNFLVFPHDPLVETLYLILKERSLEGLSQGLKGFRMAKDIEKAVEIYRNTKDVRAFTLALDVAILNATMRLYTRAGKAINVGTDRIECMRLLCPRIDTTAYVIAARLVIRGMESNIEIPACEKETVRQILQSKRDEIVPVLRRTPYGRDLPDDLFEALSQLLVVGRRVQRKRAEASFAGYPFRMTTLIALMLLYRVDAEDVATVFSGKAANLDISEISKLLSFEYI